MVSVGPRSRVVAGISYCADQCITLQHNKKRQHNNTKRAPAGDLEPTSGESRRSPKLRVGRYNQHFVDALSMDVNPVEYLLGK